MSEFYDIHENELTIPGLDRAYTVLHFSDTHLCVTDDTTTPEERALLNQRENFWRDGKANFAKAFGQPMNEYRRNLSTAEAFSKLLDFGRERGVDAVLSTGDMFEVMHGAGERYVRKKLEGYPIPFLATPGNHEQETCAGIWQEGVRTLEFPGFRIVSVDDRKQTVTGSTLEQLSSILTENVPVILMMHIPLLTDLNRDTLLARQDRYFYIDRHTCDTNGVRFLELLESSPSLKLILCGHVHGYFDNMPLSGVRQIIAPQGMAGGLNLLTVHG